jgi:glycolate dehydrogenase iron-sulfur subunit
LCAAFDGLPILMITSTSIEREHVNEKLHSLLEENNEKLLTCVHCGLCLPACPTYRVLGNENDAPRGRIYLMRAVAEGKLGIGPAVISHIDQCLGCRACETVCPSGVPYGELLEAARVDVAGAKKQRGDLAERIQQFVLNQVFTRPRVLSATLTVVRWFRDSGLVQLALESGLVRGKARFALALLLASRSSLRSSSSTGRTVPDVDPSKPPIAVFKGCVMEGLFRETNRATESVLAARGCEVFAVGDSGCCGALHAHAGQLETAKQLARRNIEAFSSSDYLIVVNAAGCGAAMKEYAHLLAEDDDFSARAKEFSARVRDVSEVLAEIGFGSPVSPIQKRVTYDAPCHLLHAQRIARQPLDLLKSIPGVELVPLRGSENCCGGAGIYNLQHPELSRAVLAQKIEAIAESGADIVATANPGCIMQIGAGLLLSGSKTTVVHPVELLHASDLGV